MKIFKRVLILIGLSYIFFMLGNGIISLTNPDEVFYVQTAKEMAKHNTWMVPYLFDQPQFEKPIFAFWLLRIAFMFFGVSNYSARVFPAFFAGIGVIAVYLLAFLGFKNEKKAFISALILLSSGLYVGLSRTVFTDMIFLVFVLLSLLSFFWAYVDANRYAQGAVLFFIFSALAILTKGPLGFIIPFLVVLLFLGIRKDYKFLFSRYTIWGFLLFIAVTFPWYKFMIDKFGNAFIREFFYNDHIRRLLEAEHKSADKWFFYPLTMVFCMFPWSIFVFTSFLYLAKRLREKETPPIYLYLFCWITVVFLLFQIAHSKLTSYIFPLFPALAIMAGDFVYSAAYTEKRQSLVTFIITWFMLLLLPVGLMIMPIKYSVYFTSKSDVYNFIFLYAALLIVMLFFIVKRKLVATVCLLVFQVVVLLAFVFLSHKNVDANLSSKDACHYLLYNCNVNNRILCSKSVMRGVRFFTDKEVAVINIGGSNFFSTPPIPYLDSDEKVSVFLRSQTLTYCILNRSSMADLYRIAISNGFKINVLNVIGNKYVASVR